MTSLELSNLLDNYVKNNWERLVITDETISDFDFSGYDLGGSFLMDVEFNSCVFNSTNLEITNFGGSRFNSCKLNDNKIIDAYWHDVRIVNTDIRNIEATRNFGFSMIMIDCEVSNSTFLSCCFTNLRNGFITGTIFKNCTFESCDFQKCVFSSVKFVDCVFIDTEIETEGNDVSFINCIR